MEALNHNYAKGFRFFELDILETADKQYVASHDWETWSKQTGYIGSIPPKHEVFKQYKIYGQYRPLDIKDINQWFLKHPDAVLVSDKINEPLLFSNRVMFKNRLIMEIFSLEKMKEGLKLPIKAVMPNWELITKMKGNKIEQLQNFGITHIAASRRIIKDNLQLIKKLSEYGIKIYVYHVNYDSEIDEKYVVCNEMNTIYGIYADQWDFSQQTIANLNCSF